METIDFRKAKWACRWETAKRKCREGTRKFVENKEIAIPITLLATTVVKGTTRVVSKTIQNASVNREIKFKQRTIYDRSLGRYVELKKPLTDAQALEIEERRDNGEKLISILDSMKLLKK